MARGCNDEFGDDLLSHRNYTIIGAGSFHCPVRDGKEWVQTAMVAKHKLSNWKAVGKVLLYRIYSLSNCIAF